MTTNDQGVADPTVPNRRPWAGPASLVASAGGTLLTVLLVVASPSSALVADWPVVPLLPGLVGLVLLPFRAGRAVGVGLAATLLLPLMCGVMGLPGLLS